jgi:hypothetical protein
VAEFEVVDLSRSAQERAQVADAIIGLSNAVLTLGLALVGEEEIRQARDREVEVSPLLAALADEEDPAGYGVNEDDRRPPEDGEWKCPDGIKSVDSCRAIHDHAPPLRGRRRA